MYESYTSKLEEIKELFENNNIQYIEENKNSNYEGTTNIEYENSEEKEVGTFSKATYGVAFDVNSDILFISSKLKINVSDIEMKNSGFVFEDTIFNELHNILAPDVNTESQFNEKVNLVYENMEISEYTEDGELIDYENNDNGSKQEIEGEIERDIEIVNGKVIERIIVGENTLEYMVYINS